MRNIISIFLIILSVSASGQQDPFLTGDVLITPIWHNPASFGTWNKFSINSVGRFSTPTSVYESGLFLGNSEFKFGYKKGDKMSNDLTKIQSGVGVNFYYSKKGFQENTNGSMNYNVQFKLKNHARLSIGLSPGFQQISFEDAVWYPPTDSIDPYLPTGKQTKFTVGAGIMYYSRKTYIGLSSSHSLEPTFEEVYYTASRNYYLNVGHKFPITRKFTIFPTFNLAYDGAGFYFSTLTLFLYDLHYTAGIGYGGSSNIRAMLGYELKNFMLQYFIGYNLNPLFESRLSHEIRFSYKIFDSQPCSTCETF